MAAAEHGEVVLEDKEVNDDVIPEERTYGTGGGRIRNHLDDL